MQLKLTVAGWACIKSKDSWMKSCGVDVSNMISDAF